MKNSSRGIIIIASIILLVSLQGCNLETRAGTKKLEKNNVAQNVENPQSLPDVSNVGPARTAESKELFHRGLRLYEQYNYQEAVVNFNKAISANPANFKVYTAKGIAFCYEGNYKDGMALIQKTLDMNPGYVPAFYDMAMAYKLQDDYDESLYWFEKTIQGDPQNTWSYYGIATIYADRGDTQESLAYLRKAIDLDPVVKEVAQQQAHFEHMRKMPEFQALVR